MGPMIWKKRRVQFVLWSVLSELFTLQIPREIQILNLLIHGRDIESGEIDVRRHPV